jgi:peptidoglycan/LPS O-acetylase OafA/YrhL
VIDDRVKTVSSLRSASTTERWKSIEGLRAWLAWIVVLSHCLLFADLDGARFLAPLASSAPISVGIFIIVSGFVITHLLLEKQEPYGRYLFRRWMRIFPLFAVTCAMGAAAMPLYVRAMAAAPWHSTTADLLNDWLSAQAAHPWAHFLAHISMLHGMLSYNLLPGAPFVYLPPAWSLSLEWQFYLLAPFAIAAVRNYIGATLLLIACFGGSYLFHHGVFGAFHFASFLPGAAPLFAVGIASRLAWPSLTSRITCPTLIALGAICLMPLGNIEFMPILFWVAFFSFVCAARTTANFVDARMLKLFDLAFTHRVALFWGERSYSVYLTHWTVLCLIAFIIVSPARGQGSFLLLLVVGSTLGVAAISIVTYAIVEKPAMQAARVFTLRGNRLGARQDPVIRITS